MDLNQISFFHAVSKIEESLNRRTVVMQKGYSFNDEIKNRLDRVLDKESNQKETASAFAIRLLPERGFSHQNGKPNYEKFYNYAWINPDVWNDFSKNRRKSSEDTLLKIVMALKMTESEARTFLSLAGLSFAPSNPIHELLLICIQLRYYDPSLVCEILDFYISAKPEKFKGYHNIYAGFVK